MAPQDEPSYTHREQLTIGIEIESACLIEIDDPIFADLDNSSYDFNSYEGQQTRIRYENVFRERRLLPALHTAGIPSYVCAIHPQGAPTGFTTTGVSTESLRQTHHEICADGSLVPDERTRAHLTEHLRTTGQRLIWMPFEISTPPMAFNRELGDKLEKLTAVLRRLDARVEESTGMHVHVGNGSPSIGFPLQLLKNLLLLWTMFSTQLEQLHPHCRAVSGYCRSPMNQFMSDDLEWVSTQIDGCTSYSDFLELSFMSDPVLRLIDGSMFDFRYRTINFKPLELGGQQTVEFRSHQTALKTYQIMRWVHTVIDLLHFAGTSEFSKIKRLAAGGRYVRNFEEKSNILQVFGVFELHHLASIWRGDIYHHDEDSIPTIPHHEPQIVKDAMKRWKRFQEDFARVQAANPVEEDGEWPEVEW